MQEYSSVEEQSSPSGMQLAKGPDDTLEAPLGTGANVLLKISMDLKDLKRCTEHEFVDVPVLLFLTDFASTPINHPTVNFQIKVECELTPLKWIFPKVPTSFNSYEQFTRWIKQGYFTNQVSITYDFHVDVQKSAPSLAKRLFFLPPDGYRFIGTHVIDNPKIIPDSCKTKVNYVSERGNTNATTVTLGGILFLNKKPYSIKNHQQVFPHEMIEEKVFKKDLLKKFYCHKWLAQSEITSKVTYRESPTHQTKNWPDIPSETYIVVQQKPGEEEVIKHLSCLDGTSGLEVDIVSRGEIFSVISIDSRVKGPNSQEAIVKSEEKLFLMQYRNLKLEKNEADENIKALTQEYIKNDEEEGKIQTMLKKVNENLGFIQKYSQGYHSAYSCDCDKVPCYEELNQLMNPVDKPESKEENRIFYWIYKTSEGNEWKRTWTTGSHLHMSSYKQHAQFTTYLIAEKIKTQEQKIITIQNKKSKLLKEVKSNMSWYSDVTNSQHPLWDKFRKL